MRHPLRPENRKTGNRLIQTFEPWYFKHNDENGENMCYLKTEPVTGFLHKDGTGFKMDSASRTAEEFPFTFGITFTED